MDVDTPAVEAVLAAAAADDLFSGVVRLVRGDRVLLEQAYGIASRRWGIPTRASMRFDTASVTKLFTSVAVFQQVEAGRVDLDTSLAQYVDLGATTISPEVTLRHLLTHTSGIADDADEEAGESYEELWAEQPNYSVRTTADHLPQFALEPPLFAPGAGCRYCNAGYLLAGLALEEVTGTSYREYVTAEVFGRAGMASAGFFDMRHAVCDVAEGWEPVRDDAGRLTGWRSNIYSYPPIGSPDGGAHVNAEDLVRFLDAVRGGELLGPELTELFLTPQVDHHTSDGRTTRYGFGLAFEVDEAGEVHTYWKEGVNTGVSAILSYYTRLDVTLALLANSEDGIWGPLEKLDELLKP